MKKPLVIFGSGDIAQLAHYYFSRDSNYEVVAFTVDANYIKESEFCGLPVVAFEDVAKSLLSVADLDAVIEIDGHLAAHEIAWDLAASLEKQVWGQGFPAPIFAGQFEVKQQKIVGERHLKLSLQSLGDPNMRLLDAIYFGQQTFLPAQVALVYALQTNEFNGRQMIQLNVRHCQPL